MSFSTQANQTVNVTDGSNTAAVKAASTAAVATDAALVVAISPNNTPLLPNGAATEATLSKLAVAQGATLGTNTQALVGASVATSPPTYTNGTIQPLSVDTSGRLRVQAIATNNTPGGASITVADSGSTITPGQNAQSVITGTPTAGSVAVYPLSIAYNTLRVQISGTWVGILQNEISMDGGTTYYPTNASITGTNVASTTFVANGQGAVNTGGATHYRIRATALSSGTAVITVTQSANLVAFQAGPVRIIDGNGGTTALTVKPASTAPVAGDLAAVVALSPNSPITVAQGAALGTNLQVMAGGSVTTANPTYTNGTIQPYSMDTSGRQRVLPTGTLTPADATANPTTLIGQQSFGALFNGTTWDRPRSAGDNGTNPILGKQAVLIGTVAAAAPTWTSGNIAPMSITTAGDARTIAKVTDGTNTAAVKASSTAPAATDAALVVTQNPVAPAHTSTLSFVNSSASSVTLLAANSARKQASFYNTSTADLYLREDGGTATTTTGFTVLLRASGGYYELPVGAHGSITTGTITGIWTAAGSGGCAVTERA